MAATNTLFDMDELLSEAHIRKPYDKEEWVSFIREWNPRDSDIAKHFPLAFSDRQFKKLAQVLPTSDATLHQSIIDTEDDSNEGYGEDGENVPLPIMHVYSGEIANLRRVSGSSAMDTYRMEIEYVEIGCVGGPYRGMVDVSFEGGVIQQTTLRHRLFGSKTVDATMICHNDRLFESSDVDAVVEGYDDPKKQSLRIVTVGTNPSVGSESIEMWKMLAHCKIGLVVSVLGADDESYACWSTMPDSTIKSSNKKVVVRELSSDVEKILPKALRNKMTFDIGNSQPRNKHVYITMHKIQCTIGDDEPHEIIQLFVHNWTDMAAAIGRRRQRFLRHLADFINVLSKSPSTGKLRNLFLNRHVYHCMAGGGRSLVVATAAILRNPYYVDVMPNLFDFVCSVRHRRHRAINSFAHYMSLCDIARSSSTHRPRLSLAMSFASLLVDKLKSQKNRRDKNVPEELMKLWCVIYCLRESSTYGIWYSTLNPLTF